MKRRSMFASLLASLAGLVGCSRSVKLPAGKGGHDPALFGPHGCDLETAGHPEGWRYWIADRYGNPIRNGDFVLVEQEEETRVAKVVDRFDDVPRGTIHEPGHWIDINFGDGPQGMMTYIMTRLELGDPRVTKFVWSQYPERGKTTIFNGVDYGPRRYVTSTNKDGSPASSIKLKPYALLLALCMILPSCTTAAAITAGSVAAKVVSPVIRQHDGHHLIGLRIGSYGGGVWGGKVYPEMTPTERERMVQMEEWILMRQIELERESLQPSK